MNIVTHCGCSQNWVDGKTPNRELYPISRRRIIGDSGWKVWFTRQKWVATATGNMLGQSMVWRNTINCSSRDLPPNKLDDCVNVKWTSKYAILECERNAAERKERSLSRIKTRKLWRTNPMDKCVLVCWVSMIGGGGNEGCTSKTARFCKMRDTSTAL